MIYGKLFKKMFTGSMVGKGAPVFAMMSYVIANMAPDKEGEEFVILNPTILAATIGEPIAVIEGAIATLCAPDDGTDTPGHDGCRLVKKAPFLYWVVNGKLFRGIIDEDDAREKAAERQRRHRDKKAALETLKAAKKLKVPFMPHEKPYLDGVVAGKVDADSGQPLPPL